MAKARCALLGVLSLLLVTGSVRAQTPEARQASAIAPFVDDQAVLVAHLGLDRVGAQETANWLISAGFPAKETPSEIDMAFQPLNALKAAGAREVYAILSPAYLPQKPVVLIVPLTPQTNAAAVAEVLKTGLDAAETIRGAVCAGDKLIIEKLRATKPTRQPLLEQALARAGDGAIQVAIALTADQRRAIEETLPELPAEAGGGPSKVLTRGLLWVAASVDLPPHPALRAIAQCQDQQAAERLRTVIVRMLDQAGKIGEVSRAVPNYNQLIPMLSPKVTGDTLTLSLQAADIEAFFRASVAPALKAAGGSSQALAVTDSVLSIVVACRKYATDHNGQWPDELKQLVSGHYQTEPAVKTPMRPVGYVYRKPDKNAPEGTVVLYEQHVGWPAEGVAVGFFDGTAERVQDQALFKKMLEKGR
jgi:hypothetical protein